MNGKEKQIMKQRIYPIGIQSFEKLRRDGYIYVDKTALIYKLVTTGSYYFLSRPRRLDRFRQKPAAFYIGSLLSWKAGIV